MSYSANCLFLSRLLHVWNNNNYFKSNTSDILNKDKKWNVKICIYLICYSFYSYEFLPFCQWIRIFLLKLEHWNRNLWSTVLILVTPWEETRNKDYTIKKPLYLMSYEDFLRTLKKPLEKNWRKSLKDKLCS